MATLYGTPLSGTASPVAAASSPAATSSYSNPDVSSTGGFLFNGTPPTDFTNVTDTTNSEPQWWQDAAQGLIAQSSAIAGQPYNTYPGPTVAPLDPLQQDAATGSTAYTGGVNNQLSGAQNTLSGAANIGNGINQNSVNSYMNPYTQGVVQSEEQLGEQNLVNNLLPAVNSTFTGAGQFGSTQNANFVQQALTNEEQTTGQQVASTLSNAEQQAQQNALTGNQQAITAGTAQGNLANLTGQEDRSQLEFQDMMGQQNQTEAQNNLNAAQTSFENQTNAPYNNAEFLNSIIHGYQPSNQTTGTTTSALSGTGANSPLNTLSAGANTLSGISGLFKEGGLVLAHKKAKYATK